MEKDDFYGEIYGKREENPTNKGGKIPTYAKSTVPEPSNKIGEKKEPHSNAWDSTSKCQESADFKPKTEEEIEKERKRRKWELIAGAIGDIGSAFANLYFTTKGAPSMINSTGKNRQPTLMERIYGRHKEEDSKYNDALDAWQKEQEKKEREFEKKKKEAEKIAKENDVIEDIHDDYKPKTKNWDNDAYIDFVFDKFKQDIEKKTTHYNTSGHDYVRSSGRDPSKDITYAPGEPFPNKSKVMAYINGWNLKGIGKKYKKQLILSEILGADKFEELDEEFLKELREELMDMDLNFEK